MSGGGVGRVHTQRALLFEQERPLELESGATLAPVEVAYETYGTLNADAGNAVFEPVPQTEGGNTLPSSH